MSSSANNSQSTLFEKIIRPEINMTTLAGQPRVSSNNTNITNNPVNHSLSQEFSADSLLRFAPWLSSSPAGCSLSELINNHSLVSPGSAALLASSYSSYNPLLGVTHPLNYLTTMGINTGSTQPPPPPPPPSAASASAAAAQPCSIQAPSHHSSNASVSAASTLFALAAAQQSHPGIANGAAGYFLPPPTISMPIPQHHNEANLSLNETLRLQHASSATFMGLPIPFYNLLSMADSNVDSRGILNPQEVMENWRQFQQAAIANNLDPYYLAYTHGMSLDGANGIRRKNATRETTHTLKAWLNDHRKNPYPTKGEKIMLAVITRMTLTQVSTWFANARRRLKKETRASHGSQNGRNFSLSLSMGSQQNGDKKSDVEEGVYEDSSSIDHDEDEEDDVEDDDDNDDDDDDEEIENETEQEKILVEGENHNNLPVSSLGKVDNNHHQSVKNSTPQQNRKPIWSIIDTLQ